MDGDDDYYQPDYEHFMMIENQTDTTYIHIAEGSNITLDCIILAKPKVKVVRWTHNAAEIWHENEGKTCVFDDSK